MWDSTLTRLKLLLRGIKFLPSDCKDELESVCHKLSFERMSNIQTRVKSELGHGLALQNLRSSTELWGFARQKKVFRREADQLYISD